MFARSLFRTSSSALRSTTTRTAFLTYKPATTFTLRLQSTLSANQLNKDSTPFKFTSGEEPLVRYTTEHEWVAIHPDGTSFVGITKYAADALGDATYVELPVDLIGETVAQGDTVGSIESVKSASEIYSPLAGEVTAVNDALEENPGLLNEDPMGEGWIVKLTKADGEVEGLLNEEEYVKLLEEHEDE
ncbi:unnamed protein product [Ambrosiozyma monospora]|uniref:Unnamed protein product n=1 Tax=Ambrosiozyma monospora TaxID=43982 RepID=A0ACB5TC08_AMBMO|nr:unnamed protein product [Ambrosiozyma monospora]